LQVGRLLDVGQGDLDLGEGFELALGDQVATPWPMTVQGAAMIGDAPPISNDD
jgi:hypothetical protein